MTPFSFDVKNTPEMASQMQIRATKPNKDSKVGIKYVADHNGMAITGILAESIFLSTDLKVGHEVVKINGSAVPRNGKEWVRTMLASTDSVVLDVKRSWSATFTPQETREVSDVSGSRVRDGVNETVSINVCYVLNATWQEVPLFLLGRGVPLLEWQRVYESIDLELMPAVIASFKYDALLTKEMSRFKGQRVVESATSFRLESTHLKYIFLMAQNSATLTNTATLVATNTLLLANSIMSAYGMRCQLDLEEYELTRYSKNQQMEKYNANRVRGVVFIPIVQESIPYAVALPL